MVTKLAWGLLALLHVTPALTLISPSMVERLYGVPSTGDVGVLLTHRGALFLAVVVASLFALFDPGSRRVASVIAAISMVGFIWLYVRAGSPPGELRKIFTADMIGLTPLAWVLWQAWKP